MASFQLNGYLLHEFWLTGFIVWFWLCNRHFSCVHGEKNFRETYFIFLIAQTISNTRHDANHIAKHNLEIWDLFLRSQNSRDSFDYEISTYDFGFVPLARKVFAFIFNPKAFLLGKQGLGENEGFILERYPSQFSLRH